MNALGRNRALVLGLALGACSGEGAENAATLRTGDAAPVGLSGQQRPALVWVINAADCLTCKLMDPAWEVRRLQQRFGRRTETAVVAVSEKVEEDRELVRSFLTSERITAKIVMLSPRRHVREFGRGAPVPAFYVFSRDGTVVVAAPRPPEAGRANSRVQILSGIIEGLVEKNEPGGQIKNSRTKSTTLE